MTGHELLEWLYSLTREQLDREVILETSLRSNHHPLVVAKVYEDAIYLIWK